MPLVKSGSKQAFKENVKTLMGEVGSSPHVKSRAQALKIAYETKRRNRAEGGAVHEGAIVSDVPGRTDNHPLDVGSGSYVLPSSHVSSFGQDNTLAGMAHLKKIGPHGIRRLARSAPGAPSILSKIRAKGGATNAHPLGKPIPIMAAGGEVVMSPSEVSVVGDGDIELGHRLLDNWVVQSRKKHIKVLKGLAPPAKD